ncbi:MAG: DJ-1 family glyoxalase III [Thermodesulfobacteriota bacterium]
MEKRVLIPLAEGFEMIEALSVVDILRRGNIQVDTAALGDNLQVTSSHGVTVFADKLLSNCLDQVYDLIALPGGIPGAENLKNSEELVGLLKKQRKEERLYGAICASPALVLEHHGMLEGKKATCHPGFVSHLSSQEHTGEKVIVDGNCITSRGAGTSIDFALELLAHLAGEEIRQTVKQGLALTD